MQNDTNLCTVGWRTVSLGEVARVESGGTPKTDESSYWGGVIPWITPKDLSSHHGVYISKGERSITQEGLTNSSAKILPPNTVLFSSRAPIGYIAIAKSEVTTNQGFKNIICDEVNTHFKYIYYWLRSKTNYIESLSSGSTFSEASGALMKSLKIDLPPMAEQRRIASILSAFDDKIELLREENKTLEAIAKTIFKEWFVDFNFPFNFETGQPDLNGKPYKKSGGKMVDSELGEVPEGWRVGQIYELLSVDFGNPFASSLFNVEKKGLPLIRIRDLKDCAPTTYTEEDCPDKYKVYSGDILCGMDAEFEPVLWKGGVSLLNQRVCRFRPKPGFGHLFVLEIVRPHLNFFQKTKFGTTVSHLGKADLDSIEVIIPNKDAIISFSNLTESIYKKLVCINLEITVLQRTKDNTMVEIF